MKSRNSKFEDNLSIALIDGFKDSVEPFFDYISNLEGVAKEIPVLGIGVSLYRAVSSFSGHRFQKKLCAFIDQVRSKEVSECDIKKILHRLSSEREREEIISEVIETIDRLRDASKTRVYANLFISFVSGNITWERLVLLAECLENLNSVCVRNLAKFSICGTYIRGDNEPEIYDDFYVSSGLASLAVEGHFELNEIGLQILRFGILNSKEHHEVIRILTELDTKVQECQEAGCEVPDVELLLVKGRIKVLLSKIPAEERGPYEYGYSFSDVTSSLLSEAFQGARR